MKWKVNGFSDVACYVHDTLHLPIRCFYDVTSNVVLHVIMFRTSRVPYIICSYFTNLIQIKYIIPYILSHVGPTLFACALTKVILLCLNL